MRGKDQPRSSAPVVDVDFRRASCPRSSPRLTVTNPAIDDRQGQPRARGRPAPGRAHGAHHRHGHHRRPGPRHAGDEHRRRDHGAGGPRGPRAGSSTCSASPSTRRARSSAKERCPIHRAAARRSTSSRPRSRSSRPASRSSTCSPLPQGRQDRPVRRRRRGQDRPHHGADQQRRQEARRLLRLRRRGRAHPRGQRPLARDEGVRRASTRPPWSTAR